MSITLFTVSPGNSADESRVSLRTGRTAIERGARRRILSILRQAYRIVGMGRQKAVGCLGAGVMTAFLIAMGIGGVSPVSAQTVTLGNGATADGSWYSAGVAIGLNATASGTDSPVALGSYSRATTLSSIAIGDFASASGKDSIALGAQGSGNYTPGVSTVAAGDFSMALGHSAYASGVSTTALGDFAAANGNYSVATGYKANSVGMNSFAGGSMAAAYNMGDIALGNTAEAGVSGSGAVVNDVAIGVDAKATGGNAIAMGNTAIASGAQSISIGYQNNVSGASSGAFGDPNTVSGAGSYAFGNNNTIAANNSFALGNNIAIAAGLDGSVGIGNSSTVAAAVGTSGATINGTAYTFAGATPASTISVGSAGHERTITNVAAGQLSGASTDAVNGSQLYATNQAVGALGTVTSQVATALGGGAAYNTATGVYTAPSYTIGGTAFNNVGGAFVALQTKAPVQYSTSASPTSANGFNASQDMTLVGSTAAPVSLHNVAAGVLSSTSTDAVNGSQVYGVIQGVNNLGSSLALNLGGGAAYDPLTGKISAPSYKIGATAYNDVGSAFDALNTSVNGGLGIKYFHANSTLADSNATGTDSVAVGPQALASATNATAMGTGANATATGALALGAGATASNAGDVALGSGSVSSGPHTGTTSAFGQIAAGGTPASVVSVGAVGSERQINNVAAGVLSATSTDAVNGSQVYGVIQGVNATGTATASALGGGATYDPATGKISAPTYNLGSNTYHDVNSALHALDNGSVGLIQYTPNTQGGHDMSLTGSSAGPVVLHNVAAGVAPTDGVNVGQLSGAWENTTSSNFVFGNPNNPKGGPVTLSNVAAGEISGTSTQAINGAQLYQTNQSISNLSNFTSQAINRQDQKIDSNHRIAMAGTAAALAAAALRYSEQPGRYSIAASTGYYRGQVGLAGGIGATSEDGKWRFNASATVTPSLSRPDVGGAIGMSYTLQ